MIVPRRSILRKISAVASVLLGTTVVTASQDQYPTWDSNTSYTDGDHVAYEGYVWEAYWRTQGDEPHDTVAVWNRIGSVEGSEEYPEWTPEGVYRTGNRVVHGGAVWEAQWWTEGDDPVESDSWGPWKHVRVVDDANEGNEEKEAQEEPDGVEGPDGEWRIVLDEQWDEFDEDRWAVGFIDHESWIPDDDASVSEDHVAIADGQCTLQIESKGTGVDGCFQGVINSSVGGEDWHPAGGVPIDPVPGQYIEARIKMPGRTGILPAFWAHPANTDWPPEIDFVELFQSGNDRTADRETLHVNAHWTSTGECADMAHHEHDPYSTRTGIDLTETFNTYGCAWFEDRIEWYFNGDHVLTRESPDELFETLNNEHCLPFGMIFSNHVNRVGEADLDTAWVEEMVIDWVRIWDCEEPPAPAATETWCLIDDFDDGEFGNWHETGDWRTTTDIAASGSHSAFTDTNRSVMTWAGDPGFERGQTLRFAFAFDDSSDQQFNCWFGDPNTDLGPCYRLDIHRDEIVLLDTDGWKWLAGDVMYENETVGRFHTAEIEFGNEEIRIAVDGDSSGSIRFLDTTYDGDVVHFDIEVGGTYIDGVKLSEDG